MASLRRAYERLVAAYGPQGWWPSSAAGQDATPWEIVVGAVLVQHTSWGNVVRAINALNDARALSEQAIHSMDEAKLAQLIRSAGPPRVKAKRLKSVASFLFEHYRGSTETMLDGVTDDRVAKKRRAELLGVHGIGPETADVILLYAGNATVFVIDAYKRRIMARHGWGEPTAKYEEVQRFWRRRLPRDTSVYAEAHALAVRVGVEHCRKPTPRCDGCPLQSLLPRGGPLTD